MNIKDLVPHVRKSANIERRPVTLGVAPLQREINRLFDDFWSGWGMPDLIQDGGGKFPAVFEPQVNVVESEKEFKVTAELPGMDEKDVQITVDEDTLTIQGEKKEEKEEKEGDYHRVERSYGSFRRIFRLPGNTETDTAKARFNKGVLTVTLTKKNDEHKDRKTIKIEVT